VSYKKDHSIEALRKRILTSLHRHVADNRKRAVAGRLAHLREGFAPAYQALIADDLIYETGTGWRGDPIVVRLGPKPVVATCPACGQPVESKI